MRNKYLLFGAAGILTLLVLAVIVGLFVLPSTPSDDPGDESLPFSDDRPLPITMDESGPFATSTPLGDVGKTVGKFRLLAEWPAKGARPYNRTQNGIDTPFVRYVDRRTGHMYDVDLVEATQPRAVSLNTLPRIREGYLLSQGSSTLLRYSDESNTFIYSYLGTLSVATDTSPMGSSVYEVEGEQLPQDVRTVAVSPDGLSFFYLEPTQNGSRGIVRTLGRTPKTSVVLETPLRELEASWVHRNTITLFTKPSNNVEGYVFELTLSTGALRTALSSRRAVTAMSDPTGAWLLYSHLEGGAGALRTLLRNRTTREEVVVPFSTMPEKCTWGTRSPHILYCAVPEGIPQRETFPDSWYKGLVRLNDTFWSYNILTKETRMLDNPAVVLGVPIDATDLFVDESEQFLIFSDRVSGLMWSYTLPSSEQDGESSQEIVTSDTSE